MECKNCGFKFSIKYPTGQRLKAGFSAQVLLCPVCLVEVCRFDEEARPARVVLHEQL